MAEQSELSVEAAVQAIIRGLKEQQLVEVRIARPSGRPAITSEQLRLAVREAVAKVPTVLGRERFRYLEQLDVQLKGMTSESVTFCVYRFYR